MAITKNSPRDALGRIIAKQPKPSAPAPATIQAAVGLMTDTAATTPPAEVPDADTPRRITALIPSGLYKKPAHYAVDHDQTVTDALAHILREKLEKVSSIPLTGIELSA